MLIQQYIQENSQKISRILLLVLFFSTMSIWYIIFSIESQKNLTISFLNVGQGDAIFIETPSGRQVLIDGGRGNTVLRELGNVIPFWDRSIDIIIVTHPDSDHIGGIVEILKRYTVSTFVHSGVIHETDENIALQSVVTQKDIRTVIAKRGQIYDFGDGVTITILFPDREVRKLESNSASVILKIDFGEHSFLLTGDSPEMIEKYLLTLDGNRLQSTVLKAGHHGSKTSSSVLFVGVVAPEYMVLSRGCDNRYGHPHKEVIDTLNNFEIQILDTCINGRITFVSDGKILGVK